MFRIDDSILIVWDNSHKFVCSLRKELFESKLEKALKYDDSKKAQLLTLLECVATYLLNDEGIELHKQTYFVSHGEKVFGKFDFRKSNDPRGILNYYHKDLYLTNAKLVD